MKPSKLFSDLSSDIRLSIILRLEEESSFTEIKNHVGVSSPEMSRHLKRLAESQIIVKTGKGSYRLTSLGRIVHSISLGVDFVTAHSGFFNRHDVSPIPYYLQGRMDMLSGCEVIPLYSALEYMLDVAEGLDIYWDISESVPPPREDMKDSNPFEMADNKSIIHPKLTRSYYDNLGEQLYYQTVRVLDDINFSVTINHDKGLIALPDLEGRIDRNHYLYGSTDAFVEWCKQMFLYYWDKARVSPPTG